MRRLCTPTATGGKALRSAAIAAACNRATRRAKKESESVVQAACLCALSWPAAEEGSPRKAEKSLDLGQSSMKGQLADMEQFDALVARRWSPSRRRQSENELRDSLLRHGAIASLSAT